MLTTHIAKKLKSLRTVYFCTVTGRKLKQQGVPVSYEHPTFIQDGKHVSIGNECSFSRFVHLNARSGAIEIGDYFSLGINSQVDAENGGFIRIGNSVLIGSNVV